MGAKGAQLHCQVALHVASGVRQRCEGLVGRVQQPNTHHARCTHTHAGTAAYAQQAAATQYKAPSSTSSQGKAAAGKVPLSVTLDSQQSRGASGSASQPATPTQGREARGIAAAGGAAGREQLAVDVIRGGLMATTHEGQPVTWGHVPISVEAKVLLAQYNVKPHVALRMAQELGLQDTADLLDLDEAMLAPLGLKPLERVPVVRLIQAQQQAAGLAQQQQPGGPQGCSAAGGPPGDTSSTSAGSTAQARGYSAAMLATFDGRADLGGAKTLVTGCRDGAVRLWDLVTGDCTRALKGHMDIVTSVVVAADGETAVSGSWDHTLRVWSLSSGLCTSLLQGHTDKVNCVALSPGGERVVSGSWDKTIRVWSLEDKECVATLEGHTDGVTAVAVTADGATMVSGSWDRSVRVWNLCDLSCRAVLKGHRDTVSCVAVMPHDIWTAVSGSWDRTVRVWDLVSGTCTSVIERHTAPIYSVAVTPNGRTVISGSDKVIKAWDLATGNVKATLEGHSAFVSSLLLTPDGKTLISGSTDKTVRLWRLSTGACLATHEGHGSSINSVALG